MPEHRFAMGRTICALAAVCAAVVLYAPRISAETIGSEYAVKAAIVFKLAKFVSWPSDAFTNGKEPLSICLPENDPIASAMQGLAGQSVHGRMIEIQTLSGELLTDVDCEVLFISAGATDETRALIAQISDRPVLTVGDDDQFIDQGGIVSLKVRQNRVQFAINVEASEQAGLDISAQLLQLAGVTESRQAPR